MPKMEFRCNAKPSLFAYPPPLEEKKKDEGEKVETAILSITNKRNKDKAATTDAKETAEKEAKAKEAKDATPKPEEK